MGYLHFEVNSRQSCKQGQSVCGDLIVCERGRQSTTLMLCDGVGSGIRARIAARLTASRLFEFQRSGASTRQAFLSTARAITRVRDKGYPYAAFSVAHILTDGNTTILGYDAPPPVVIMPRGVAQLEVQQQIIDDAVISQSHTTLSPGDSLLLVSDGVTEAGLGIGGSSGWQSRGLFRFLESLRESPASPWTIPGDVVDRALEVWGGVARDDISAALITCRDGAQLTVLTGPPRNDDRDEWAVQRFIQSHGKLAICGASTAQMFSRISGRKLETDQRARSFTTLPATRIRGVDLVTEGAVTLNQLSHILDRRVDQLEVGAPLTALHGLICAADRIEFLVGGASNPVEGDIEFVQSGIAPRSMIVPRLAEQLRATGKLVVISPVD